MTVSKKAAVWTVVSVVRQINHRMAITSSFHNSGSPGVPLTVIPLHLARPLFIPHCSAVSLPSALLPLDIFLLAPQVRFNGHGLRSQFPLVINPQGPHSTGAVIRSLTLTSWVLIHAQTPRNTGDWWFIDRIKGTWPFLFTLGCNVWDAALWRVYKCVYIWVCRWHAENVDEQVACG